MSTTTFNCSACFDDLPTSDRISVGQDHVCQDCFDRGIEPQFLAALEHEHSYPVTWGNQSLDALDFLRHLPVGFGPKWMLKQTEYEMPASHRIYCQHRNTDRGECCSRFLGGRIQSGNVIMQRCMECHGLSCRQCGAAITHASEQHTCRNEDTVNEGDPLRGLKRGEDYQLCPGCNTGYGQWDGCNAVRCTQSHCRTLFCFICSEAIANENTGHFKPGKPCPKWGKRGALNAIHDDGTHQFVDVEALAAAPRAQRLEDDEAVSRLLTVTLEVMHIDAHRMIDANTRDVHARAFLRLVHELGSALRDHFRNSDALTNPSHAEIWRDSHVHQQQYIETQALDLDPDRVDPNLVVALDLWRIRHRIFIDRLNARIELLWEQMPLEPHLDRQAYRFLQRPPRLQRVYLETRVIYRVLDLIPADRRTLAEKLLRRLSRFVRNLLRVILTVDAFIDLDFARSELQSFDKRSREARRWAWQLRNDIPELAGVDRLIMAQLVVVARHASPRYIRRLQDKIEELERAAGLESLPFFEG